MVLVGEKVSTLMALIAAEVVEEWLRQQGYFTIRGIKFGVKEMDILAIKPGPNGIELRHVEVQVSMNPVSHITPWAKRLKAELGISGMSPKPRGHGQIVECVEAWDRQEVPRPEEGQAAELALSRQLGVRACPARDPICRRTKCSCGTD